MSGRRLDELRAETQCARERYRLYNAKAYGRPTSQARMQLERAYEGAEPRLRAAEAKERRARSTAENPPVRADAHRARQRPAVPRKQGRGAKRQEPSSLDGEAWRLRLAGVGPERARETRRRARAALLDRHPDSPQSR